MILKIDLFCKNKDNPILKKSLEKMNSSDSFKLLNDLGVYIGMEEEIENQISGFASLSFTIEEDCDLGTFINSFKKIISSIEEQFKTEFYYKLNFENE